MESKFEKYRPYYISLFLAAAVLAVYLPVRKYDFVRFDDDKYVTKNRNIQSGITEQSIHWAFTSSHASNWHPLTWISHMLDYQVFGLNAGAHHLVNVLLHIVNTLLLFIVFTRMTKALWASAFIAAVFGLHPLHIESVAWVAERKDVLSTFFWLLTMLTYFYYTEKPDTKRCLLTLLLFAAGLLAKPMLVTMPFVLLLLDYWPLERMRFDKKVDSENKEQNCMQSTAVKQSFFPLVMEKIPFFILAAISSIVTFIVQKNTGAVRSIDVIDIKSRIGNAIVSYIGYICKMFWPSRLAVLYPHPGNNISTTRIIICGLLLVLITVAVILLSRRKKYLVTGWFWYIGTLVPVIGLVQVGVQAMADRYTYIPMTGILIIIVWGARDLIGSWKYRKEALAVVSVCVLLAMSVKTSIQLKYWQNSMTLFRHTLDVTQDNYIIENNYANLLFDQGQIEKAIEYLNKSLAIEPSSAEVHNNLAAILSKTGKTDEAIIHYRAAIKLKPDSAEPHHNLAIALSKQGKTDEAIKEYYEALRLDPDNVDSLSNLGFELADKGNYGEAVEFYKKALAIEPGNIITRGRLGLALAGLKKNSEAINEFLIVLKARPNDVEMWCNLGIVLERQDKITEAIEQYRHALQIEPENEKAKNLLQSALKKEQN
jgi:tetratricopeptide (TPR) repeat protein